MDVTWDLDTLRTRAPARFSHPNKQAVQALLDEAPAGQLRVRQWAARPPADVGDPRRLDVRIAPGAFDYDDDGWWPNFADRDLFGFWDGPLLAQDELQVLEHPVLGSVRKALVADGLPTRTVDADGRPAPFTLEGVPRRVALDVRGLYGNAFARASVERVLVATRVLQPPTTSRIYAMAAPACGSGPYTTSEIDWILTAATTAFAACGEAGPADVHAGFWGCGAFGGDRVLMALLQIVAASAAGVRTLTFHTLGDGEPVERARARVLDLGARLDGDPLAWVLAIHRMDFRWGFSDGN